LKAPFDLKKRNGYGKRIEQRSKHGCEKKKAKKNEFQTDTNNALLFQDRK